MDGCGIFYWLRLFLGNACYIVMLLALGKAVKRPGERKTGSILLMAAMFAAFILLNPLSREIKQLGIVAGKYGSFINAARLAMGILCAVIPYIVMWCYMSLVFDLKQRPGRKKYTFYVYHNFFFLFGLGFWCIWMYRSFFVAVATTGRYKLSWEWIFGVLTAVCYVGGVCMAVLRQKAFVVMMDGRYSFYDFKIACEGELKDIEEIEEVKQGIILHTRERELFIKCGKNMFIERLKEIVDGFKDEREDVGGGFKEI